MRIPVEIDVASEFRYKDPNTVFLHLSEEAIKRLNKLRGWRKVSRSAILREAVEQYLERQQFPVRKAKGGRQRDEAVGVEELCKQHKE